MMTDLSDFESQLAALEQRLGNTAGMVAGFEGELAGLDRSLAFTGQQVEGLSRSFGGGLRRAFDGVVFDGMRLKDALRMVARSMSGAVYNQAMAPVQNALGAALARGVSGLMGAMLPFGQGGAFGAGRVMPFAKGGVISQATAFPMRGGSTGLMGEAGPEAIMPLARGPDGRLGVQAAGGGGRPVQVTLNIQTPDVEGFRRSQVQIAAELGRVLARGERNY